MIWGLGFWRSDTLNLMPMSVMHPAISWSGFEPLAMRSGEGEVCAYQCHKGIMLSRGGGTLVY
jgi:hypothetical protein